MTPNPTPMDEREAAEVLARVRAGRLHMATALACAAFDRAIALLLRDAPREGGEVRSCTCHPDDNPPRPCPRRYALGECRAAATQPPDAPERDAVAALAGKWDERAKPEYKHLYDANEAYKICADELAAARGSRPVVDEWDSGATCGERCEAGTNQRCRKGCRDLHAANVAAALRAPEPQS